MPSADIYFLTAQDIVDIHSEVTGNRCMKRKFLNKNNLLSVVNQVPQFVFGQYCYHSLWDKAAAYMCLITWNHPFQDGNKRTAFYSGMNFLEENYIELNLYESERRLLMIQIASNRPQIGDVASILQSHVNTT